MAVATAGEVPHFKPQRVAEHPVRPGEDKDDFWRDTFGGYRYDALWAPRIEVTESDAPALGTPVTLTFAVQP